MPDYFDLGGYRREVTTSSAAARAWFDRGLLWTYAFNHEEAVRCFERAIANDPDCALAYWGLAYALGPNYNKTWEDFDPVDLSSSVSRAFAASVAAAEPRFRRLGRRAGPRARSGRAVPVRPSGRGLLGAGTPATPTRCATCTGRIRMIPTSPCCSPTR